ncbi:hypothetical protein SDC9_161504 [bioreactor metagenome]|uniref:Uncharacterized protein n=1 Tax=bioreactor metagenome TaxID=1076179 RepID=A0A645FIF0_9ZZZZ
MDCRLQQCFRQFPAVHACATAYVKGLFDVCERLEDFFKFTAFEDSDVSDHGHLLAAFHCTVMDLLDIVGRLSQDQGAAACVGSRL